MTYIYPNPFDVPYEPYKPWEPSPPPTYPWPDAIKGVKEAEIAGLKRRIAELESELKKHVDCKEGNHEWEYIDDDLVCKHCGVRHPDFVKEEGE